MTSEPRLSLDDPCAERQAAGEPLHQPGSDTLDVFLTGQVFMDMIFTGLPGLPPPGTEIMTQGLGSAPGGVANIAIAMSRLGLRVGLAAVLGDDLFGAYLWKTLSEQEGVDLTWSRQLPGWPTPVTVSLSYDSDRSMITYAPPPPAEIDAITRPPAARTCFVSLDMPIPDWALKLRKAGTQVFADVGWDHTGTWSGDVLDRLGDIDVFTPNAVEAMAYTGADDPQEALVRLATRCPVVVVKCGAAGAIAIDAATGDQAAAPALPVTALDPTGAGDVFAAGFTYGTLAGWTLEQRLRFANLCAGLSVRHYSGSLGSPCWGEIASFGEGTEVPAEVLEAYAFLVPYIPEYEAAHDPDLVMRAQPTLRP